MAITVKRKQARIICGAVSGGLVIGLAAACGGSHAASGDAGKGQAPAAQQNTVQSPSPHPGVAADEQLTKTKWGPMSAADKALMTIVRQTSLREITSSEWAMKWSKDPKVKQAAAVILKDHELLNRVDLEDARRLGLKLPDKPRADMAAGLKKMKPLRGKAFDKEYVNQLRIAHGQAFVLIANVRAYTRNTVVRAFANLVNRKVMAHMYFLDRTGDVNDSAFPIPKAP